MTIEEKRNMMITEGRIILSPLDFITHYTIVWAFGLINVLVIVLGWDQNPPNPTNATMSNNDFIVMTIINLMLMGFLFLVQREKLKIKNQSVELEVDQIFEVIQIVGVGFDWLVKALSKDFVQADIYYPFAGNRVSIFIREHEIYINCRTRHGIITGFSRQNKITEAFLSALRMKSYELKYQRDKVEKIES